MNVWLALLLFWHFAVMPYGSGRSGFVVGPFKDKADCEAIREQMRMFASAAVTWCWIDR